MSVKYMGSKRAMLGNGLGEALSRAMPNANRVLDLFTGSAAVAWHIAENHGKEVIACDLQQYATILAASVIERTEAIIDYAWLDAWFRSARARIASHRDWKALKGHQARLGDDDLATIAEEARAFDLGVRYPISKAYGAHYFSPWQSAWLDALRASLPVDPTVRNIGLAALIQAASRCVLARLASCGRRVSNAIRDARQSGALP